MLALREGAGPQMGLMLDLSFSQRTEGYLRIARRLEDLGLYWLELDLRDPEALALVRRGTRTPIASLESLHGPHEYRPYLAARGVDTAIVDPLWNGVAQSVRVAWLADAFDTHVAPHNPVGELGNLIAAQFCAAVPNLRILELRHDEAPWTRSFVTRPTEIVDGEMLIPPDAGLGRRCRRRSPARPPAARRCMNGETMRVVYWARLGLARAAIIERLSALPDCELVVAETLDAAVAALPGAQALVLYDAPRAEAQRVVDALAGSPVRWMHFVSAGREGFEAVGLPPGIAITYAAGAVSPTVAEHAFALLLALVRRIPEAVAQQGDRRWDRAPAARASSLEGGVLAVVGTGHIGLEVARRARAFGMRTVGLSRRAAPDALLDESLALSELHAVLARADAVVVAIALTAQTRHLIGAAEFDALKPGALLVNIARGGVIDQPALCAALQSGRLGGAGLDVTSPEPLPADDPLWACPNLLITPHFAGGGSAASVARLAGGAADNLQRLIDGRALLGLVQAG